MASKGILVNRACRFECINYFIKCIFLDIGVEFGKFGTSKGILVNRRTSRGILVLFPK